MARLPAFLLALMFAVSGAGAADMVIGPDILAALDANARGAATPQQRALLFKHNDKINRARMNNWISDRQYQAAQSSFAEQNEIFARRAAEDIAGEGSFARQAAKPGKPKIFSAGTDSDYITKVESAAQVKAIQERYNHLIDKHLADHGVLERPGTRWHNRLDSDFMANPDRVSKAEFEAIAKLNNDAYRRQLAAEYEAISRAQDGRQIRTEHVRAYADEMQDFITKKQRTLEQARSNPEYWRDGANRADIYRAMAQEQKYIERTESLNDAWRRQNGLPPVDRNRNTDPYHIETDGDGRPILRRRIAMDADGFALMEPRHSGSMAQRGAMRTPKHLLDTYAANAVSENSLHRALRDLAETHAEASRSNIDIRRSAPSEIAHLTKNLPAADKGVVLERVRNITRSNFIKEGWPAEQAQQAANRFTAEVAGNMRQLSPPRYNADIRRGLAEAFEQGRRQALANGVQPGSFAEATRALDAVIRDSVGLSKDLSSLSPSALKNMSLTRQQANQLGEAYLNKIGPWLNAYFVAHEVYDAGRKMHRYMNEYSVAMNPNISDAEADIHFQAMEETSRDMIQTGLGGAAFAYALEAFPTFGAVVGTGLISYAGTRWVLENTYTGQIIDRATANLMDAGFSAWESATDTWRGATGGETSRMRDEREAEKLLQTYERAIEQGRIRLRAGVTMDELAEAVRRADLTLIARDLVARDPQFPPKGSDVAAPGAAGAEPYCLYVLDVAGGSVFIGHPSQTKAPACRFDGGGLCRGAGNSPPKILQTVTCKNTKQEVTASWCSELSGKRIVNMPMTGDAKANVYGGDYWLGLAPSCRDFEPAGAQARPSGGDQGCVVGGVRYEPGATACILADTTPSRHDAASKRRQEEEAAAQRAAEERRQREAARQREEQAAAERARVESERAEQAQRQRQAARAAAAAECAKQNAELKVFNADTGRHECACRAGMVANAARTACITQQAVREERRAAAAAECAKQNADLKSFNPDTGQRECACRGDMLYNLARIACVTREASRQEHRVRAAAACSKQNAELKSFNPDTGVSECACRSGLVYNRSRTTCVTQATRQAEASAQCGKEFPNSVVTGYTNDNKERCGCPAGMTWGGPGGKSCVAAPQAPTAAPRRNAPVSGPTAGPSGPRPCGGMMHNGRCITFCKIDLDVRIGGPRPPACPNGGQCFSVPGVLGGASFCYTDNSGKK